jgi:hypothetical protein
MSNRLYDLRQASGDSLEGIAETLGVTTEDVARWEIVGPIPDEHVDTLRKRYGVSRDHLLRIERCDACGSVAEYRGGRLANTVCRDCATIDHGDRLGAAFAAAEMFMASAQMAHQYGLTVGDLHKCVSEALEHDPYEKHYDVPTLEALMERPRADKPSLSDLKPVS